ncbi:MAG: hypothetical protein EZS28_048281 [Streblomastix strix]|uniref:Uncharacterized protein n=1 Tax=Streblomastix strix TaxID=222440 RepID=A0A5J4TDZ3_9EUKA|nr:MAG: hypothetical protein EZS28_048281 [Streblomastix strix]
MPPKLERKRDKPLTSAERKKIHEVHKRKLNTVKIVAQLGCVEVLKMTTAEDRIIRHLTISNRNCLAGEIATMLSQFQNININAQTVIIHLAQQGYQLRLLKKIPLMTKKQKG